MDITIIILVLLFKVKMNNRPDLTHQIIDLIFIILIKIHIKLFECCVRVMQKKNKQEASQAEEEERKTHSF